MNCNLAGIALIKKFEGCRLEAYRDGNGTWTCGWGATGPDVAQGLVWTQAQADARLLIDLHEKAEVPLEKLAAYELDPNRFSALCSLIYNIGAGNFEKSAVLEAVNAGDFEDVPDHMRAWCHDNAGNVVKGLVARREAEIELWDDPSAP
ncbi:MAG: lysozyme [Thermoplasmata archaeon]